MNNPEISSPRPLTTSGRMMSTAAMPRPTIAGARPDRGERRLPDLLAVARLVNRAGPRVPNPGARVVTGSDADNAALWRAWSKARYSWTTWSAASTAGRDNSMGTRFDVEHTTTSRTEPETSSSPAKQSTGCTSCGPSRGGSSPATAFPTSTAVATDVLPRPAALTQNAVPDLLRDPTSFWNRSRRRRAVRPRCDRRWRKADPAISCHGAPSRCPWAAEPARQRSLPPPRRPAPSGRPSAPAAPPSPAVVAPRRAQTPPP